VTAEFGDAGEPLADARGSEPSHHRKGVVFHAARIRGNYGPTTSQTAGLHNGALAPAASQICRKYEPGR
jgi:hypothetical protein